MDEKQLEIRKNRRLFWGGLFIGWILGMVTLPLTMLCEEIVHLFYAILTGAPPK